MLTPMKLTDGAATQYGLGWMLDDVRGHRRVHHGGTLPGFRAEFSRYDDSLGVIVLTNADSARTDAIGVEVANHYIRGLSPDRPVIELPAAKLAEYVGRYRVDGERFLTIAVDGPGLSIQFSEGGRNRGCSPRTLDILHHQERELHLCARGRASHKRHARGSPAGSWSQRKFTDSPASHPPVSARAAPAGCGFPAAGQAAVRADACRVAPIARCGSIAAGLR